jgi:hypothetical protein
MELVESGEDEDSRSGEEIKEIKDSEGAVWIKSSPGGLGSRIVIRSSSPEFNKSSPKGSGSRIVIGSSPPEFDKSSPGGLGSRIVMGSSPLEFDGLGIGMQSKMQLPGRIETSRQTVVGGQTGHDLNRQGVC